MSEMPEQDRTYERIMVDTFREAIRIAKEDARAAENEACARIAEELIEARTEPELNEYQTGFMDGLDCALNAIRSRLKQGIGDG